MATKVIMPKQGLQMTEGTIISWLAAEGDQLKEGDPLFEMETDKLTIEINAPAAGTLLKIVREEGDVVPITETVALIGEKGEDISALLTESAPAAAASPAPAPAAPAAAPAPAAAASGASDSSDPSSGRIFSSPRARLRAEEKGVAVESVSGSGPEGLIIERDILALSSKQPSATPLARKSAAGKGVDLSELSGSGPRGKIYQRDVDAAGNAVFRQREDRVVKLSGMRKTIAAKMRESLDTAAQAVHRVEVDMSEVVRMRSRLKSADVAVSYNDIVLKAVATALAEHPRVNAAWTEEGIIEYGAVNLGMAVAVEDGLLVPVIRDADLLPLSALHNETGRLGEAARTGTLMPDEMTGGTFSVSNLGMFEIDSFTAIINRPESGILAVGAIKDKAVAADGAVVIRPVCQLSLTYDHRVVDGAPAAQFLRDIKRILENPYLLV